VVRWQFPEHTPNLIGWLCDILSVLKPSGVACFAVPDKRYTFDILRTPTPPSIVIDNFLRKESLPRAQHIFDHYSQVVEISSDQVAAAWEGTLDPSTLRRFTTDEEAYRLAQLAEASPHYIEGHMYVFTPRSMLKILETTIKLGLLRAEIHKFWDTAQGSFEFVFVLRKPDLEAAAEDIRDAAIKTAPVSYPTLRE
jgi:hypothetical protein